MTAEPTPTGRPRWLIAVLVAAVVAAAVGIAVGWRLFRSGDTQHDPTCQRPVAPLSAPTQPAQPGLSVTEQGHGVAGHAVSIGAIITNTSQQAAYRTRVTFRVLKADGTALIEPNGAAFLYQEIPVILPGQRIAVGANAGIAAERIPAIDRVEINLGSTRWVPADTTDPLYRPVKVTIVGNTSNSIQFNLTTDGCTGFTERGVGAVYRNPAGTIVGGALTGGTAKGLCDGVGGPQSAATPDLPPDTDVSKTQISVYCDVAGAPKDRSGATPPAN